MTTDGERAMETLQKGLTRREVLELAFGAAAGTLMPGLSPAQQQGHVLRVAISTDTLAGANVNDARAAYKVWVNEITRQQSVIVAQMVPEIFLPSEEMTR